MNDSSASIAVLHLQRRAIPGYHSVERLFADVRAELKDSDIDISVRINRHSSTGLWPRLRDAWAARRAQRQINHVTGDVHYLAWWLDGKRTVLTVLDCVGLERLTGWRRALFKWLWYTLPARKCRYLTVISEFTKRELIAHTGCSPERIRVIHPHLSDEFQRVDRPFETQRPRILQVGTTVNKNIETLAAALAGLDVDLAVLGQLNASQRAALDAHRIRYSEQYGLSRAAVVAAYANCDLVAFVSRYEGFGLPIIEAQAVGRAVITSSTCSMPEVAADAACIVDPEDVAAIRAGIVRLIDDSAYRNALIARGYANVERFRLVQIAQQYAELYRQMARELGAADGRRWQSAH